MTPEQIIAEALWQSSAIATASLSPFSRAQKQAEAVLSAFAEAGWSLHRLDDHERLYRTPHRGRIRSHRGHLWVDQGPVVDGQLSLDMRDGQWVYVVPVESDSPEGDA